MCFASSGRFFSRIKTGQQVLCLSPVFLYLYFLPQDIQEPSFTDVVIGKQFSVFDQPEGSVTGWRMPGLFRGFEPCNAKLKMIFDSSLLQVADGFLMPGALIGIEKMLALILFKLAIPVNQRRYRRTVPEGFVKQFKTSELITNCISIFLKQVLAGHPGPAAAH
ncbi:hypothetical protein SDC9_20533 [bioreactor metagenome]|uniref:Uncharacterized protein n=1 Tax=bioreactor metagenome TaxID=1076179 RepID=A0A644U709_9ZZZZ